MAHRNNKEQKEFQHIRVFVRSRPLNKSEKTGQVQSVIDILNDSEIVVRQPQEKRFKFHRVFGPNSTQLDVYVEVVAPLIPEVLAGYNCTVFAYGQTGTGKTYTMAGGNANCALSWKDDPLAGCIPRACVNIFDELNGLVDTEYTVQVSYTELYNEELNDLLADASSPQQLKIYEDPRQKGSVFISGLREVTVCCREDIYKLLQEGAERRKTATTLINHHSSRSHCIFTITVHIKELTITGSSLIKTGKLNLVDLAGSENIGRSGAKDVRAREASNINQSLLTLGRVMKALVEGNQHIPYRESKLTRMLQDSLGGCTKTSIIATITPAIGLQDETLNTLDYAYRAQNITNTPQIHAKTLKASAIKRLRDEVEKLHKDLAAARSGSGFLIASENYKQLVEDGEKYKKSAMQKKLAIQDLQVKIKELEIDIDMKEEQWNAMMNSFEMTRNKMAELEQETRRKAEEARQEKYVAEYYEKMSKEVTEKAKFLLNVADSSSKNNSVLHRKIDTLYTKLDKNTKISEDMFLVLNQNVADLENDVNTYNKNQNDNRKNVLTQIEALTNVTHDLFETFVCLENRFNSFRKSFSSNSAHSVDFHTNMFDNMKEVVYFQNKFTESVSVMYSTLNNTSIDDINNLLKDCSTEAENIAATLHKVFEIFEDFKQTARLFDQNMKSFKTFVNDYLQQLKERIILNQVRISDSSSQIDKLNTCLVDVCAHLKNDVKYNHYHYMMEFRSSCNEKLEEIFKDYTTKSDSVIKIVTEQLKKLDVHRNDLIASQERKTEHVNEIMKQEEQAIKNHVTKLEDLTKNTKQYCTNSNEKAVELKSLVEDIVNKFIENVKAESTSEIILSQQSSILNNLQSITESANSFEESHTCKLDDIHEHLKNTYIDQLEPSKHEGDTPKRENFKHASIFERQLQRDALLKEFKQTIDEEDEECTE